MLNVTIEVENEKYKKWCAKIIVLSGPPMSVSKKNVSMKFIFYFCYIIFKESSS